MKTKEKKIRRVVRAERRKPSKTFPGYWKYELDIEEVDGSITESVPAYGVDLQDALSRTLQQERVIKVEQTVRKIPNWVLFLLWTVYFGIAGIMSVMRESMIPILGALGILSLSIVLINQIVKYKKITD